MPSMYLLIPFTLIAIALGLLIWILDLTVAMGTINGLIFYANVLWANQVVFFPFSRNVLYVFIAWLNFDLGIETCFIDGLEAYWKTWIQFLYAQVAIALLLILCRYSSFVARILGNNTVPVLATLLLLSYAKLAHTILIVMTYVILDSHLEPNRDAWSAPFVYIYI